MHLHGEAAKISFLKNEKVEIQLLCLRCCGHGDPRDPLQATRYEVHELLVEEALSRRPSSLRVVGCRGWWLLLLFDLRGGSPAFPG